jgi:hypothetical protein
VTGRLGRLLVAAVALATIAAGTLPAAARSPEQRHYQDAGGLVVSDNTCATPQALAVGRVCFDVKGARVVSLSVIDDAGLAVAGSYSLRDGKDKEVGGGAFCQGISGLSVPDPALHLWVYPHENVLLRTPADVYGRCAVRTYSSSGTVTLFYGAITIGDGDKGGAAPARPAAGAPRAAQSQSPRPTVYMGPRLKLL